MFQDLVYTCYPSPCAAREGKCLFDTKLRLSKLFEFMWPYQTLALCSSYLLVWFWVFVVFLSAGDWTSHLTHSSKFFTNKLNPCSLVSTHCLAVLECFFSLNMLLSVPSCFENIVGFHTIKVSLEFVQLRQF